MTILFAGGEMGAFTPSDANAVESISGVNYDSAFARSAISATSSASYNTSPVFTTTADLWFHFEVYQNPTLSYNATQAQFCTMLNGSATEVFRVITDLPLSGGTMTWQLQYWNGAAWANLGSSFTAPNVRQTIDIHIVANSASGSGTVYLSGTERSTGTADLSSIAGVAQFRGYGRSPDITTTVFLSQVMVSTLPTIGFRATTAVPTGAGSTSDWTGGHTEVDEIVYSDTDFVNSATNGQVELFTHGVTVPTGYLVRGVAVTARAKRGASGVANLQLVLKSGGTTDTSASKALGLGYGAYINIWETDPATSGAWTASAITALQFGVKAIT